MTPPSDEARPATAAVGRSRRKRFSLAGLNLGSNSKASEKEASANNDCHNDGGCGSSSNREDGIAGTNTNSSGSSGRSLLSPKTPTNAATTGSTAKPTLSAATAVASRDPRARRGSLPIFDRISAKEEPGDSKGGGKGDTLGGGGGGGGGIGIGGSVVAPASAATSGVVGVEVTANTDFERRGPPRRRHSASARQIEAITRQAFGGGDAAAYESDSSSDSSAWLNSDSDDED
eukprot:CAMPEP_0181053246 /NCGR_PEP_ID=MMETSP1070-20121207/18009_1 /TAXON_ID=265543 /ORGANISM="Minutocellus polymorphus, Strain NH13" /LENGTH=231 /DNA_ID=CAMNT_0023132369 /DNA_START=4 /DNA_END=699 /DNA_ORIENTATION=+